jgi:hypothetical protein
VSQDASYRSHILDAIAWIEHDAAVGEERFFKEHLRQDAIIRQQDDPPTRSMRR